MNLEEVDLNGITEQGNADLQVGSKYLCLIGGELFAGSFTMEWYGLCFDGWLNHLQFDPPGSNSSRWQRIWKLPDPQTLSSK